MRILLLILLAKFLLGCATTRFEMTVNTIGASPEGKGSYLLLSGLNGVKEDDLQFQEYSKYIDASLMEQGYLRAEKPAEADLAIMLTYGVGDPQTYTETSLVPVFEYNPGTTYNVNTSTQVGYSPYNYRTTGTVTTDPSVDVSHYTTKTDTYTRYTRIMKLTAYDLKAFYKTKQEKKVWETTVVSTGASNDLRLVFPYLVYGAKSHFGVNTGHALERKISAKDSEFKEFKQSILAPATTRQPAKQNLH